MAKKGTALFVLWIAAVTCLCWGWGEEVIQNVMDGAKSGAEEAKQSASEVMQDAKDKTSSWADLASNKFSEGFGLVEGNVKDASRRLMFDAKNVASEVTDTVNAAADWTTRYTSQKACEMASMAHDAERSGGNNREAYEFTADKLGGAYDFASNKADHAMKPVSEMAADAAQNSKGKLKDRATDAYSYTIDKASEAMDMESGKDKAYKSYTLASDKMDEARGMAADAKEKVKDKASDAYTYTLDKTGDAIDRGASDLGEGGKDKAYTYASDKAADAAEKTREMLKDTASDKKDNIIKMAWEKGSDDKESMDGKLQLGEDEVLDKYEDAKSNVQETYRTAKDTMTQKAKDGHDAAKENASQATGELGRRMRGEDL